MKLLENVKTNTYDIGDGFRVDVVQKGNHYDGWIYHEDYGIKEHMFGITSDDPDEFLRLIENADIYINNYRVEYMR